ncbi:MAG: MFS transporter, partial [Actinocatenispora sp.]
PLERGTGLTGAVERTATTVGPAIAGVVVAAFGSVYALFATAALFGLGALIVAVTLTDPEPELPAQPGEKPDGYLRQLREGASFLRHEGLLRAIVGMVAVTNLLDQAFMAVLLPVWAKASGHGPALVGLTVSVFGGASIVASLAAAGLGERLPRRAVYLIGFVIGGVPRFAAMALGFPLWPLLAVFAVGGLGSGFINPIIGAVTYERIPTGLLGRVKTLTQGLSWSGIPFGGLVGAALTAMAGLSGALWIVGGCYLVAVVLPGLSREWSRMARRPEQAPQSATVVTEAV